jgi:hypothetical protein
MRARQQMTLGLLAAAIILVGYAYFVESKRELKGETTDVEVWSVSDAAATALQRFEVNVDGKTAIYEYDGGQWRLSTEPKRDVDSATFNAAYNNYRNLMATRKVQDGLADLGKYGLDKPSLVLTLGDAKSPYKLELGQKNAIGDAYYAHSFKDDAIYAIASFRVDGWRALGLTPPLVALPSPSASPSVAPSVAPTSVPGRRRWRGAVPAVASPSQVPLETPTPSVLPSAAPSPSATMSPVSSPSPVAS